MKLFIRPLLVCCLFALAIQGQAQVSAPAPSPSCKVVQKVGLTDITIEYARPSVKGRTIFGELVPYGKMWRTGANKNTTIEFSDDVTVSGHALAKGKYALFTVPGAKTWEVIFYKNTENWGTPRSWNEEDVAVRFTADAVTFPKDILVESFLINISELRNSSALIELLWENTMVPFKVEVPTDSKVTASIEKVMAGPSAGDYYTAARYYREEGKELGQALTWIDKAIDIGGEKFWVLRQKALIQAAMKDYKGAIATATRSKELAAEAGNDNYIKNNEKSIAKWASLQ